MKLSTSATAERSATVAILFVLHPPAWEVEWGFVRFVLWDSAAMAISVSSIRTLTVGPGLAPGQPRIRGSRTSGVATPVTASGDFHPALKTTPLL